MSSNARPLAPPAAPASSALLPARCRAKPLESIMIVCRKERVGRARLGAGGVRLAFALLGKAPLIEFEILLGQWESPSETSPNQPRIVRLRTNQYQALENFETEE